ncbi:MAG: hypothetical protein Q8M26_08605 [Pseudolabrys sp.]|nr:hypothetical protein [Pseudolabrys sp.]
MSEREQYEYRRIYVGDPFQPYAQDQMNAAGKEGWEIFQVIENDALARRKIQR